MSPKIAEVLGLDLIRGSGHLCQSESTPCGSIIEGDRAS
jgi:hypothetical protein